MFDIVVIITVITSIDIMNMAGGVVAVLFSLAIRGIAIHDISTMLSGSSDIVTGVIWRRRQHRAYCRNIILLVIIVVTVNLIFAAVVAVIFVVTVTIAMALITRIASTGAPPPSAQQLQIHQLTCRAVLGHSSDIVTAAANPAASTLATLDAGGQTLLWPLQPIAAPSRLETPALGGGTVAAWAGPVLAIGAGDGVHVMRVSDR